MMNQNMELAFGYEVAIQTHSLFLALGQQSLEHYHVLYMAEYQTYPFSITYSTAVKRRSRSSRVRQEWFCLLVAASVKGGLNRPCLAN